MKILVTGAYSSGKTSFCGRLQKAFRSVGFDAACPQEAARSLKLPLNASQDAEVTALLIGYQISAEMALLPRHDILICDRGLPDIFSHDLEVARTDHGLRNAHIRDLATSWCTSYSYVIQSNVDHSVRIPADGIRVTDGCYRARLEAFHRSAMRTLNVKPDCDFGFEEGSIESAINEAVTHVR